VKLLLVGQGFDGDAENSEPDVARYIREHGIEGPVRMLGYRPDVPDLLRAIDVFCLVSYKEGLPLSVIEAMACGLPVVATNIEGLRDVVRPGINGVLVDPDDTAILADVLMSLAADPNLRHVLGERGRRIAQDRYSFARCLSQTESLLLASTGPAAQLT
jgi:glycosyltransferase involved in cell wall biosynthesis